MKVLGWILSVLGWYVVVASIVALVLGLSDAGFHGVAGALAAPVVRVFTPVYALVDDDWETTTIEFFIATAALVLVGSALITAGRRRRGLSRAVVPV